MARIPFTASRPSWCTTVAGRGHERAIETLTVAFDDCHRMRIVAKLAEIVAMNDVDDMPETMERARAAGKKLAGALQA